MGRCLVIRCEDCGWSQEYLIGEGMRSHEKNYRVEFTGCGETRIADIFSKKERSLYEIGHEDVYDAIIGGKYGPFVRNVLVRNPNSLFNYREICSYRLMYCSNCEDAKDVELIKELSYEDEYCSMKIQLGDQCPKCNQTMQEINEYSEDIDIECPICKKHNVNIEPFAALWD